MGCGGSKGEGDTGAGSVPKAQGQSGTADEKAKDVAAAEIQKAAKVFKEKKEVGEQRGWSEQAVRTLIEANGAKKGGKGD